jgi:hypothetical protein
VAVSGFFASSLDLLLTCTSDHVILDLEPFLCVLGRCLEGHHNEHETGPVTFETSKAWSSHMRNSHREYIWECRAVSHELLQFTEEGDYQRHSIEEHGVLEAYVGTVSNAARRSFIDMVLECPFGDDFPAPEKVDSGAVFSSKALQSHIADHMEDIAMLTLQKLSEDDGNAQSFHSDQASDDEGPGRNLVVTRASMHSLLDNDDMAFPEGDMEDPESSAIGSVWRQRLQERVEGLSAKHGIPLSSFVESEEAFRTLFEAFARKMREPYYTKLLGRLGYFQIVQWARGLDELEPRSSRRQLASSYRFVPFIWTSFDVLVQVRG